MSQFDRFSEALKKMPESKLYGVSKALSDHSSVMKALTTPAPGLSGGPLAAALGLPGAASAMRGLSGALMQSDFLKQVEEYTKTSDKIRALAAASVPRADIARHLGVRYQHVRNVLVRDEEKAREAESDQKAEAEGVSSPASPGGLLRGRLGADGRVVVPAAVREKLGLEEGAELVFTVEGDEVRLASMATHLKRLQEKVRSLLPNEAGLVDELIADRKREAGAE